MAALTIKHDGYFFFNEAAQASSEVVGYENSHQRGIRYKFTIPTSRTAGATSYSFTKTSNGHGGGTSGLRWNYALSTDASAYLDTCAAGDGYAKAAATFSGSKTGLKLLPGTVYYLFIYPGEEKLGWYFWNYPDGNMTFSVDGDITYSVSYNANGGSGAPGNQTKTHGTSLTLSSTKPTKSSTSATGYKVTFNTQGGSAVDAITSSKTTTYTFSKWNTKSDGSGTSYDSGASYTANAAATLYAQYTSSTSNGAIKLPSAPTKSGYTFNGWYDATSGGTKIGNAGASYTPTKAITLYAQWKADGYSITYTLNGGTVSGNPTSYTADTATFTLKNPTREGYNFAGWTGSNGSTAQTSVSIAKGSTGNKSYTANWTPKPYTISYTLNSGTVSGNPTSYTIETATFTLKNPTRTNYTFTGWTGSNGTTPQTTVTITKGSTGDKSYTANWSQNVINYTIEYNYDGGVKGSSAPTSAEVDKYVTISNPTKSGYTFKGWSISGMNPTSSKKCYYGSSTTDSSNQSTTSTSLSGITATSFKNLRTSAGTVTFTATWEAIPTTTTYTIAYSLDGGTAGSSAPTSADVGSYVTISNPTKSGYTFKGWNITGMNPNTTYPCYYGTSTTDSSNTKVTSGTSLSGITATRFKNLRRTTGTVTFTATWEENPKTTYTISYSYDGGVKGTYAPTTATVDEYFQVSAPTKSGYTFTGWNISGLSVSYSKPGYYGTSTTDSTNTKKTSGTTVSGTTATYYKNLRSTAGTVTFTATWEENPATDNTYTITYSLGTGGTAGNPAPTSGTKGTYINIANPTRTNYTFNGWNITGLDSGTHYHGNSKPSYGNTGATSVTGTSISGVKSTWFSLQATGTVTFTATWTATQTTTSYTISYSLDGGNSGTYAPTTADVGSYVQISNPTKNGYTFKGWNITNMNPNTTYPCYYGTSTTDSSNTRMTSGTSISGTTATQFKNLRRTSGTVTFTATWEENPATTYTISYDYDGGQKGTYAPTSAKVGSYVQISNPTRSNYTFKGWSISGLSVSYTNPAYHGTTQTDSSNTRVTSGTTLSGITSTYFKNLRSSSGTVTFKATWEAVQVEDNEYSITYSLGGGTAGSPAPTSGTKGTYINIANPSRTNYTFTGWNITGLDSGTHYHGNSKPTTGNYGATSATGTSISGVKSTWFSLQATGTVTFTATWESSAPEDEELTGLILRPVSDTALGHTCSSGTSGYSMISEATADDDTTYIYQQITETTDQTATSTFKLSATMPSGQFKITGATIKVRGKSDSNGTYSGTYQLSTDTSASAITLNATAYESTFNSNVCSSLIGNTYTSSTFPEISVTITTTGKTTSTGNKSSGQTAEIHITQVYLQLEYEAIVDNTYDIVYTLNGGNAGNPAPSSGTKGTYVNIANPTRSGYTFTGWNITGLDSGTHYHGTSKPYSGNYGATSASGTSISGVKSTWFNLQATGTVTFTANWELTPTVISYTIQYNYDGGVKGTYAPTSANVDAYVQISNPSKSGFTFKGWNITGMNPTSSKKCYYGSSTTDTSNQSTTATSLSGITATRFKNLRTSAGTVTFTATWEDNTPEEELTGLILRPIADTTLGHTCSSGTAGYSMISETTADDNTTYIYQQITEQTAQSATSTFKLGGTLPSGAFKITGATIRVRGKSDSNGTYSGTYQLSTDSAASNITLSATAYSNTTNSDVCNSLIGNIYTSSTLPDISVTITTTGQITSTGTKTGGQTSPEIRITQVYLQLEYEPVLGLAKIYTNNAWHNALSYIFINGTWKIVQAHARKNSNWKPGQG